MFGFKNQFLICISLVVFLGSCSSSPPEETQESTPDPEAVDTRADEIQEILEPGTDSAASPETPPEAGGLDPDEIEVVLKETGPDPAMVGLLRFFSNLDRGIVVYDIDWASPLSQQNPGIDCELRHLGKGTFQCVVGANNQKVVIRVEEGRDPFDPKARRLSRITLETSEANAAARLKKELGGLGFRLLESKNKQKAVVDTFSSSTGDTRADVISYLSKNLVTLSLKPSGPPKKLGPKSAKRSRATAIKKGAKKAKK